LSYIRGLITSNAAARLNRRVSQGLPVAICLLRLDLTGSASSISCATRGHSMIAQPESTGRDRFKCRNRRRRPPFKMKRTIGFALVAVLIVVAFAFLFQSIVPGWYGSLLFQTCLIFGAVGLIAGFSCGLLARQAPAPVIARSGLLTRDPENQGSTSRTSAFISSPGEGAMDRWNSKSKSGSTSGSTSGSKRRAG